MPTKLDQLKSKLRELFQLDRPDLDFGFYRVMHAKQGEIEKFLNTDLLPQVQAGLEALKVNGGDELAEAIKQAEALGVNPDTVPKVQVLKAKLGEPVDLAKTEDTIYSNLYRFFSRYYDAGDFISMRRYKEGVYAIPYEGEEVVLHWANKDQYYIKSSENLRDYTVKLADGDDAPRLHFKLVEADIEKDNRKTADDKKRLFIFNPETVEVTDNKVTLGFEYRADPDGRKQPAFITACVDYVKEHAADFGDFSAKLLALKPTEKKKDRTLLEKHLVDYTAKNSMDYFIHKDLGGFLRRELDFYIKNEIMHLDDIENETAPRVEQYLVQIKVLRGIAHKLIDFLAQLEEFQKKLWLKKKFVVESNWCITLDRVPEELYEEIAANKAQWAEWEKLGFIIESGEPDADELGLDDQAVPKAGTVEYLKTFPYMVIDTAFYDAVFKQKLLASIDNIDEQTDGLLIHSENFQALNLLQERYKEQVKCVYIDPPYNTGGDGFPYKDGFQHSSWNTMMWDRGSLAKELLSEDGSQYTQIDYYETHRLRELLDELYVFQRELIWDIQVLSGFKTIAPNWIRGHETLYFHTKTDRYFFNKLRQPHTKEYEAMFTRTDENGRKYMVAHGTTRYWDEVKEKGKPFGDVWSDVMSFQQQPTASERISFQTQKPEKLLERVICSATNPGAVILDYFGGSGTTAAAAQKLDRKYVLCEMGEHFNDVVLPRMKKALNGFKTAVSSSLNYEGGGCFKYMRLESYEDCLNNLELARTADQDDLLSKNPALKEDYTLRYMLDVESKGSLLNVAAFADPFNYTLKVATSSVGETKPVNVDLVETFNYLIGLKVQTQDLIKGVTVLTGENLAGEKILVLWRKVAETDNEALNKWFIKQGYNTQDMEFDVIYVNGDNHLENLRKDEETWKVRLIEEEFMRRMFSEEGVE